jgi:hypothetical protein
MSSPVITSPFPQGQAAHYDTAVTDIRERLHNYLSGIWVQAGILLASNNFSDVVGTIANTVTAAQLAAANLTSAYLAQSTRSRAVLVNAADITIRENNITKDLIYQRPFRQAAIELASGKSEQQASKIGLKRLQSIAATDIQMGIVRQSRASLQAAARQYYRRIPTGRETCAMCLIAATQRYKVKNLLPIHGGCDCIVGELPKGMDLDHVIDLQMLEDTHQQVKEFAKISDRGGRMPDYRELLVSHEHGEIGPVIAWRGQNFTGPRDLAPKGSKRKDIPAPPDRSRPPEDPLPNLKAKKAFRVNRDGDLKAVNPFFATGKTYQFNCTHCVTAHELRRRGYDVEATPLPQEMVARGGRATNAEILSRWEDTIGTNRSLSVASGKKALEDTVRDWGDGARGWVTVHWRGGGGHIFLVENNSGKIEYSDPQDPAVDAVEHIRRRKRGFGTLQLVRVDDLTPTEDILRAGDPLVKEVGT